MSFLLDPPLLVASGAVVERMVPEEKRDLASAAVLGTFVGASYALYLNVPGFAVIWKPLFKAENSKDFMLRSGMLKRWPIKSERGTDLAAIAMFAMYPAWFFLGRRKARKCTRH